MQEKKHFKEYVTLFWKGKRRPHSISATGPSTFIHVGIVSVASLGVKIVSGID